MTEVKGSGEAVENIILPVTSFSMFDGGSVMVWGAISMEGCTDLYRLSNGTLTAISRKVCVCVYCASKLRNVME